MQLAAHETHDLHELTLSCVNSITNMALYMNQVKDQQLKSLLEKHFPYHIKDYNTKVGYLKKTYGAIPGLPVPEITNIIDNFNQSEKNIKSITPRTDVHHLDDREIAAAYLLTLKRAGREYAWAVMECSNPEIRRFLEDAFIISSHLAYDVWQWMVKKGYYPLEAASAETLGMMANMYETIPENNKTLQ